MIQQCQNNNIFGYTADVTHIRVTKYCTTIPIQKKKYTKKFKILLHSVQKAKSKATDT